ncbi:transmembrane protein 65-like [Sycon ciliatum]|uniref:transmembrane protein 65-like n=1 Tax=Sycon ciliatum TaxID=27933 RepID=UPI0020ABE6E1|eukprot:scpid72367/ scgid25113/ Transmembrane protein 65
MALSPAFLGRLCFSRTLCQSLRDHGMSSGGTCSSMLGSTIQTRESTSSAHYFSEHSPHQLLATPEAIRNYVSILSPRQRRLLLVELDRFREHSDNTDELRGTAHHCNVPDKSTLTTVMFANFVPFVGFGFLDNAIMIAAGESIEMTLGAVLCISTMAAAALGNLVSDVAGMGLASGVESVALSMGLSMPKLTSEQLLMRPTRVAIYTGRTLGLTIGCIIGMFPLLFIGKKRASSSTVEDVSDA